VDGSYIAVGFVNGSFSVFTADGLKEEYNAKHRKETIEEIKFSPNGKWIAVGSHDNFVDIYEVGSWKRIGRCSGNSSYITHLDFSADSGLLMTNSGAYEQLYFQMPKGERSNVSKEKSKSIDWATWSGVLGDQVVGIWPKNSDGTDINSTDLTKSKDVLATGDDFGLVKLFHFPSSTPFSKYRQFKGHSAHVTKVRFTYDDHLLISTGGGDASIFQWIYKPKEHDDEDDEMEEDCYDSDVEKEKKLQVTT
jgi:WD40 repeat protein